MDASDPEHFEHERTTGSLLDELGLGGLPRLRVYNKVDRLDVVEQQALAALPDAVAVSALCKTDLGRLLERVADALSPEPAPEPAPEPELRPSVA